MTQMTMSAHYAEHAYSGRSRSAATRAVSRPNVIDVAAFLLVMVVVGPVKAGIFVSRILGKAFG
jgi:hypothetical protein